MKGLETSFIKLLKNYNFYKKTVRTCKKRGGNNCRDYWTIDFWNSSEFIGTPWDSLELLEIFFGLFWNPLKICIKFHWNSWNYCGISGIP
jgi:hypothetical protein